MNQSYEHIEVLIAKQLAGETMPEEQALLQRWRSESPENQRYFDELQRLWEHAPEARRPASRNVDTEAALKKVKAQLQQVQSHKAPNTVSGGKTFRMGFWMRAAAVLLGVVGAVFLLRREWTTEPQQIMASAATILTDTLSDGSVVTLNRNSGLTLKEGFNRKERRIKLSGEAYFEVAHDKTRPFVIEVADVDIKVVGTSFNVDNKSNPDQVLVSVTTGKVLVGHAGQSLLLLAGEQAVYDKKSATITRLTTPQNPNVTAYKSRVFLFDATPLGKVVKQLNEVYGANIILKNKALENCLLTARYNNLSQERVLELIAESFSVKVIKNADGSIVIDGAACGSE